MLQPSIRSDLRCQVFWALCDRLSADGSLDPENLLRIYDVDNVDASVLPHLAEQFFVTGYRGWILADTEEKQRSLIKNAIELHRHAGTPYAIRLALESVGYPDAVITENPGLRYDGSWTYNGTKTYSGNNYTFFEVTLDPERSQVDGDRIELILGLIEVWKNARSKLLDLRIGDISLLSNLLQYNGAWQYNGGQNYDGQLNI